MLPWESGRYSLAKQRCRGCGKWRADPESRIGSSAVLMQGASGSRGRECVSWFSCLSSGLTAAGGDSAFVASASCAYLSLSVRMLSVGAEGCPALLLFEVGWLIASPCSSSLSCLVSGLTAAGGDAVCEAAACGASSPCPRRMRRCPSCVWCALGGDPADDAVSILMATLH